MLERAVVLFPVWAVAASALAFSFPGFFIPLQALIVPALGLIMLSMGMTLSVKDFRAVLRNPGAVFLGVGVQYLAMPFAAFALARIMDLPPAFAAGMILVGSCPGGTASNVISYLAGGNVALSVSMTFCSTLASVLLTPALVWLYAGSYLDASFSDLVFFTLQIVLVPVAAGVLINAKFGRQARAAAPFLPLVSTLLIVAVIAAVAARSAEVVAGLGFAGVFAVAAHNCLGLAAGYLVAGAAGYPEAWRRTLGIEVGMQNSGFAIALATQFFSPAAALPGAVFSVWHNVSGSLLAGWWNRGRAAARGRG